MANSALVPGNTLSVAHSPVKTGNNKPRYQTTKRMLNDLLETAVSEADCRAIIKKAVALAIDGDAAAREFVWDRKFGKAISELDREIILAIRASRGEPAEPET